MTSGIDLRTIGADLRLAHRFRESVQTKGRRYLIEGRLNIHHISGTAIEATARGQGHIYGSVMRSAASGGVTVSPAADAPIWSRFSSSPP